MNADWQNLARAARLKLDGEAILVTFGDERRQTVEVKEQDDRTLRLTSRVLTRSQVQQREHPLLDACRINRMRELVGFKIAEKGHLIGECWVPTVGLTAEELSFYVLTLARACDWLEHLWTGRDEN